MSYGPASSGTPMYGFFGRQLPQMRQASFQTPAQQQNPYQTFNLPTQGMYAPHQSLVRNSMMLGFSNPFQSLGYGAMPTYNRYVPPPPPPQPAPAPAVQEPSRVPEGWQFPVENYQPTV